MDLIQCYNEQGVSSSPESSPPPILNAKSSAPEVDYIELDLMAANVNLLKSKPINPTYVHPYHAPAHPYAHDEMRNHKIGFVEDASIDSFVYNTFHDYGYVGDMDAMKRRKIEKKKKKGEKKEEIEPETEDPVWLSKGGLTEEQKKYAEEHAKKKKDKGKEDEATEENKSIFHVHNNNAGKCMRTYIGVTPPNRSTLRTTRKALHCAATNRLISFQELILRLDRIICDHVPLVYGLRLCNPYRKARVG